MSDSETEEFRFEPANESVASTVSSHPTSSLSESSDELAATRTRDPAPGTSSISAPVLPVTPQLPLPITMSNNPAVQPTNPLGTAPGGIPPITPAQSNVQIPPLFRTLPPQTRPRNMLDMPQAGGKNAPRTFTGSYKHITKFLSHFVKLCVANNVVSDSERIACITDYVSTTVKRTLEGMPHYQVPNWVELEKALKILYDADKETQRYKSQDLVALTDYWRTKSIRSLTTWKHYLRKFIRIAGWLRQQNYITGDQNDTYFWHGLNREMKTIVENRILAQDPKRDMTKAFTVTQISEIVEAHLTRGRFDSNLTDSNSDSSDSSSDSSQDDSDSEDDGKARKARKDKAKAKVALAKKKAPAKKKTKAAIVEEEEEEEMAQAVPVSRKKSTPTARAPSPLPPITAARDGEVEEIIRKLNGMSLDDATYGLIYYQARKLDPLIVDCVRKPITQVAPRPPPNQAYQNNPYGTGGNLYPARAPPANTYMGRPPGQPEDRACFGCSQQGHLTWECPALAELVAAGTVKKGFNNRTEWPNGTLVRREMGVDQNLVDAIKRQRPQGQAQTHLVTLVDTNETSGEIKDFDEDPRSLMIGRDVSDEDIILAMSAQRGVKGKARTVPYPTDRPATRSHIQKTGGKLEKEMPQAVVRAKKMAPVVDEPTDELTVIPHYPVPLDVVTPRFNRGNDAEIEEDPEDTQAVKMEVDDEGQVPTLPKNVSSRARPTERRKMGVRQSAVSAHVDPLAILNMILNTPVTMAVGELLAVSKEVSGALSDSIKLKNMARDKTYLNLADLQPGASDVQVFATSFQTRNKGLLIKMHITIDDQTILAIIDTGSMLNIVNKNLWRKKLNRPMDILQSVNMNDANGGQSTLQGLVQDVPIICGGVKTLANLYVGSHVPFDLLLGRPWQRGNFVSIDERPDGTYLLFRNPGDKETRYELMVVPEEADMSWNFDASIFTIGSIPETEAYLITVPEPTSPVLLPSSTAWLIPASTESFIPGADLKSGMSAHLNAFKENSEAENTPTIQFRGSRLDSGGRSYPRWRAIVAIFMIGLFSLAWYARDQRGWKFSREDQHQETYNLDDSPNLTLPPTMSDRSTPYDTRSEIDYDQANPVAGRQSTPYPLRDLPPLEEIGIPAFAKTATDVQATLGALDELVGTSHLSLAEGESALVHTGQNRAGRPFDERIVPHSTRTLRINDTTVTQEGVAHITFFPNGTYIPEIDPMDNHVHQRVLRTPSPSHPHETSRRRPRSYSPILHLGFHQWSPRPFGPRPSLAVDGYEFLKSKTKHEGGILGGHFRQTLPETARYRMMIQETLEAYHNTFTYAPIYEPSTDPRRLDRENARVLDARDHDYIETYYNDNRNAQFSQDQLTVLRAQVHYEQRSDVNVEQNMPPGFQIILDRLKLTTLPFAFNFVLEDRHHEDFLWTPIGRCLDELYSINRKSPYLSQLRQRYPRTPAKWLTPAPSPHYEIGPNDPFFQVLLATRWNLMTLMDEFEEEYTIQQWEGRSEYVDFLRIGGNKRSRGLNPRRNPGQDHGDSPIHPLLHRYEATFLEAAARRLQSRYPENPLSPKILEMVPAQFVNQTMVAQILAAGHLDHLPRPF